MPTISEVSLREENRFWDYVEASDQQRVVPYIVTNLADNITLPNIEPFHYWYVNALGGNDTVTGQDSDMTVVFGGAGNDSIFLRNPGLALIYGGSDNDTLGGANLMSGGQGNDVINGWHAWGPSDELTNYMSSVIVGGDGIDLVDYYSSDTNLTIDLRSDNVNIYTGIAYGADIGRDTLGSIENVNGGRGSDTIIGSYVYNALWAGQGHDRVYGEAGNDTLWGYDGEDILWGGGDHDLLFGEFGNDTIYGEVGNDTAYGGQQDDRIYGWTDQDLLYGEIGNDWLYGEQGNDTLDGGWGVDRMYGGTGNDSLWGAETADYLYGEDGDDTLLGGAGSDAAYGSIGQDFLGGHQENDYLAGEAGNDTIWGDEGNDTAYGGGDNDRIYGNIGDDLVSGDLGNDTIEGGDGRDVVWGGAGLDFLHGGNGDDGIWGGADADTLYGVYGNDTLNGEGGADKLYGGFDNDTYQVMAYDDFVSEVYGSGSDTVQAWVSFDLLNRAQVSADPIEAIHLQGAARINAHGDDRANVLVGNGAANFLNGRGGADHLNSAGGGDTMAGGLGDDTYEANSNDVITEAAGAGTDRVNAHTDYTLANGVSVEVLAASNVYSTAARNLNGNEINQTLVGNFGRNVLDGKAGADTMFGYHGDDTYVVDSAGDVVNESGPSSSGNDSVLSLVNFSLADQAHAIGTIENLTLAGQAVAATGNGAANWITGNAVANVMTGGGGADTFRFNSPLGGGNIDRIADFNAAEDTIMVDNAVMAGLAVGALAAAAFTANAAGVAQDASDRIIYQTGTGKLFFDSNGSAAGGAVQFAVLTGAPTIGAADFLVV